MAQRSLRRSENIAGNIFVDETCIDCAACRIISPAVFQRSGPKSAVYRQPEGDEEILLTFQALYSCPTSSIGYEKKPELASKALRSFPRELPGGIYHCGFHSEQSFGATSYFIKRESGNILVDSPRFNRRLAKNIADLGGIEYMFLTHRDDIADHEKWSSEFNCRRIMHEDDLATDDIEMIINGVDEFSLADDLKIIPVPGHTRGSMVLLFDQRILFTGDHLAYRRSEQHLTAFRNVCWYSWPEQKKSMQRLSEILPSTIEGLYPGHGGWWSGRPADFSDMLKKLIIKM